MRYMYFNVREKIILRELSADSRTSPSWWGI